MFLLLSFTELRHHVMALVSTLLSQLLAAFFCFCELAQNMVLAFFLITIITVLFVEIFRLVGWENGTFCVSEASEHRRHCGPNAASL